jgi:hypothetical protein
MSDAARAAFEAHAEDYEAGSGEPLAAPPGANLPRLASVSEANPGRFGKSLAPAPPLTPFPR